MSSKKDKSKIRIEICDLLDRHCVNCEIKFNFYKKHGASTSFSTNYCNTECPIGAKLLTLGEKLNTGRLPTSVLDYLDENEKENEAMNETVEAKSDKPKITKEEYIEEHKTKSNAQIEREWGMKYNTLYQKAKAWGVVGKPKATSANEVVETDEPDDRVEFVESISKSEEVERLRDELHNVTILRNQEQEMAKIELGKWAESYDLLSAQLDDLVQEHDDYYNRLATSRQSAKEFHVEMEGNGAKVGGELEALMRYVKCFNSEFRLEVSLEEVDSN